MYELRNNTSGPVFNRIIQYGTSSGVYELNHEGASPIGLFTCTDRVWVLFGYADCKSNKHGQFVSFIVHRRKSGDRYII